MGPENVNKCKSSLISMEETNVKRVVRGTDVWKGRS